MSDVFEFYGKPKPTTSNVEQDQSHKAIDDIFADYAALSGPEKTKQDMPVVYKQPVQQNAQVVAESQLAVDSQPSLEKLFDELNLLIGLESVKSEVRQLIQFVKIQDLRRKKGLGATNLSLHSVFYGNPGTGKTSVARIYGRMLRALGLLTRGHLVETDRAGLVANYIGQTANKTDDKAKEAMGGVLFIDEAYSLYKGEHAQWDFGSEAIEILMKRMEDNRDDFVVIVAGYPEPMDDFLNSNEGFKSRFANYVHFDDYDSEQLAEIFVSVCNQNNYFLTENAYELAKIVIGNAHASRDKSFGNARFCRNLFEKIIRNQALRIGEGVEIPTEAQLETIEGLDIYPLLYS
jgi:stage V sporulation protein K